MHFIIRDTQGLAAPITVDASTGLQLQAQIQTHTGLPCQSQRLFCHGRPVTDLSSLTEQGLYDYATIDVSVRTLGGGPKKRCNHFVSATERCSQAAIRIVGDCSFCNASFCGRHRLPEDHICPNLQNCKQEAFDKNKSKLESEQTVNRKIEFV